LQKQTQPKMGVSTNSSQLTMPYEGMIAWERSDFKTLAC